MSDELFLNWINALADVARRHGRFIWLSREQADRLMALVQPLLLLLPRQRPLLPGVVCVYHGVMIMLRESEESAYFNQFMGDEPQFKIVSAIPKEQIERMMQEVINDMNRHLIAAAWRDMSKEEGGRLLDSLRPADYLDAGAPELDVFRDFVEGLDFGADGSGNGDTEQ